MSTPASVARDRLLTWLLLAAYLLPQLIEQHRQRHRKPPPDRLRVIIFREWQGPPT